MPHAAAADGPALETLKQLFCVLWAAKIWRGGCGGCPNAQDRAGGKRGGFTILAETGGHARCGTS